MNLTREWAAEWPLLVEILFKLAVAFVCGFIIGYERERRGKPAGLKTGVLVVMGACIYVIAAQLAILHTPGGSPDVVRVIGQVVTGIGFLGAGVIMQAKGGITGLTTAAAIWYMGAVGCIVGVDYPILAIGLSLTAFGVLAGLKWVEDRIARGKSRPGGELLIRVRADSPAELKLKEFLTDLAELGLAGERQIKRDGDVALLRLPDRLTRKLPPDYKEELFEAGGLIELKIGSDS
jgi:putative Mg2+ transporter-C (MgtC) family protein